MDETNQRQQNSVHLRGRVSGGPEERVLPSGSVLVGFRLVVPRPRARTAGTRGSSVISDWVACSAWSAATRRVVGAWEIGDHVEVTGALRRRQFRGGGSGSMVEVEVLRARRLPEALPKKTSPSGRQSAGDHDESTAAGH